MKKIIESLKHIAWDAMCANGGNSDNKNYTNAMENIAQYEAEIASKKRYAVFEWSLSGFSETADTKLVKIFDNPEEAEKFMTSRGGDVFYSEIFVAK
jgi:hypothetical protein